MENLAAATRMSVASDPGGSFRDLGFPGRVRKGLRGGGCLTSGGANCKGEKTTSTATAVKVAFSVRAGAPTALSAKGKTR